MAQFQDIRFMLADMAMELQAARRLTYAAAAPSERGETDLTFFSAAAKCVASDTSLAGTVDAVQLLGGYGFTPRLRGRADGAGRQDHQLLR